MTFTVRTVDWEQGKVLVQSLRESVFVVEWRIPQTNEFDSQDETATHVVIFDDTDKAIATGRLTQTGELGRIAVNRSHRTLLVYKTLFATLIDCAK